MTGTRTPNIQSSQWIDTLLGNYNGSTRLITLDRLIALLTALSGPTYATRAELFADLAWPPQAIGRVYGDGNAAYQGIYKKTGVSGSGSWTKVGELPTSAVEVALINELRTEMRQRRAATIWAESFAAATFPEGTDTVIQRQNTSNWSLWGVSDAAVTGTKQQDASGKWWLRLWGSKDLADIVTALSTEVRDGRVYMMPGGTTPSGAAIPTDYSVDLVICHNNALGLFSMWRGITAPQDGLETSSLKRDANGNWWTLLADEVSAQAIAAVQTALATEADTRAQADGAEALARTNADNALRDEMRDGRVFYTNGTDPSGTEIPDWADVIVQSRTANNTFSLWRPVPAPANNTETADLKKSSNGLWFVRLYNLEANEASQKVRDDVGAALGVEAQARMEADTGLAQSLAAETNARTNADTALRDEMREGRVWTETGALTPSGLVVPVWAKSVQMVHNASGTTTDWRPRGAPTDGVETATVVKDGAVPVRWWTRVSDNAYRDRSTHTGTQPMSTVDGLAGEVAALGAADTAEATTRGNTDALLRAGLSMGGAIPLADVAGTADAITANIHATMVAAGITTITDGTEVIVTPLLPNTTTTPTLTVGGATYTLRTINNVALVVGDLVASRPYRMRRYGSILRIMAGSITGTERAADQQARITSDAQMGTVQLESVAGTGDVITGNVPTILVSSGISGANVRRIAWVQPAANTGAVTINIDGNGAIGVYTSGNVALAAGHLVSGRTYEAVKISGRWRLVSDVTRTDVSTFVTEEADARMFSDAQAQNYEWPGDGAILARDKLGNVASKFEADGTFRANLTAVDILDAVDLPQWPGDTLLVTHRDSEGYPVAAIAPAPSDDPDDTDTPTAILPPEDAQAVGDAFHVFKGADGQVYYLSTQWGGQTIGYEMRDGVSIAQTKAIATGYVAFGGGGMGVARALPQSYPYHLYNSDMGPVPMSGAAASAMVALDLLTDRNHARPTSVAISEIVASTVEADALPTSPRITALLGQVSAAVASMGAWGKTLFVDRITLSLLEGASSTGELTTDSHYASVANNLRQRVSEITGQAGLPIPVVSQSAGTRTDGTSEVILGESRLDWTHFALGFVVATPKYPFPLATGMPATHTAEAYRIIAELEALAVQEVHAGREWYCPSMEQATLSGNQIVVRFTSMSNLVLADAARHGFTLEVDGVVVDTITSVAVSGVTATITLSAAPTGAAIRLRYAWGRTGDQGDGYPANRGSVRDSWGQTSKYDPSYTLRRYARSGRVTVTVN